MTQVLASVRPFNTGIWSTPVRVDVGVINDQQRIPKIAINTVSGNDHAVVIWQNIGEAGRELQSSQLNFVGFTPGTWSSPIQVSQPGVDSFDQDLVVDSTGTTYAIWSAVDEIQTAELPFNGTSWTFLQNFSPVVLGGESFIQPKITLGSPGFIAASWIFRVSTTDYNIQSSRFESGVWINSETIPDSQSTAITDINMSADLDNNLAVIWSDFGLGGVIRSSYRPFSTGMWSALALPVSVGFGNIRPDIVLVSGQAHAVWEFGNDDGFREVAYANSISGAPWSAPCVGISNPTVNAETLSIVVDQTQYGVILYDLVLNPESPFYSSIYGTTFFEPLPLPTVTSVSPTSGSINGQNSVLITGENFTDVQSVEFGLGNPSPSFTVISPTQILAVAPSGPLGPPSVDVIVITSGAQSLPNEDDLYLFIDPVCWQR